MDRLTSMQVFVRVAELGSFAAAARSMGLSPAMVAKHIRVLEERLQVTLIRRTTRRQSLTDVGGPVDAGRGYLRAARHGNPDSRTHAGPGAALRLGQIGGDRRAVTGRRLLKVPRSEA